MTKFSFLSWLTKTIWIVVVKACVWYDFLFWKSRILRNLILFCFFIFSLATRDIVLPITHLVLWVEPKSFRAIFFVGHAIPTLAKLGTIRWMGIVSIRILTQPLKLNTSLKILIQEIFILFILPSLLQSSSASVLKAGVISSENRASATKSIWWAFIVACSQKLMNSHMIISILCKVLWSDVANTVAERMSKWKQLRYE